MSLVLEESNIIVTAQLCLSMSQSVCLSFPGIVRVLIPVHLTSPRLHDVILEYGAEGRATLVTGAVERCTCPPGEEGRTYVHVINEMHG